MPATRPSDPFRAESERLAREFLRYLHPRTVPSTRNVKRLAYSMRLFARFRMAETLHELRARILEINVKDRE
jgi:hypothetical protein